MKTPKPTSWVIIAYDVPNQPSKLRLRVWRELKKAGAVYPSLSFCILPNTTKTMKHALNLKNKVKEYGHVIVFKAKAVSEEDYNTIVNLFQVEREKQYKEILEECHEFLQEIESNITGQKMTDEEVEEMEESLEGLERWFERVKAIDWISVSPRRKEVEKALEKCKDALTDFAERAQARGAIHQPKEEKRRQ
jgi:DNA-binding transcriptional regulator GbsR (MarR family)